MYHHAVPTGVAASSRRRLLLRAGLFLLLATAITAWGNWPHASDSLSTIYFFDQDALLLLIAGVALILLSMLRAADKRVGALDPYQVGTLVTVAAVLAYVGSSVVFSHYGVSRDETMAEFGASHLRQGMLGLPVPYALSGLGRAIMPLWADARLQAGYWTSNYLPVNSAFRALADLAGDRWLTGPVLLAVGAVSLWSAARRIWPTQPQAATVALVLTLTSAQLLTNAMTAYAMTGHFALNSLWLACFLRGDRRGHVAALMIGLVATGLHQYQFHIIFVSGFIVWMWFGDRRSLALLYAVACLAYLAFWIVGYQLLLDATLGARTATATGPAISLTGQLIARIVRLSDLQPLTSLARFAAWQNILMLPLAVLGATRIRDATGRPSIILALSVSCAVGLSLMVYQGHGYGYRYLHGLLPCFALLSAAGWLEWEREAPHRVPADLLVASAVLAIGVTIPFTLWRSHSFAMPYAQAYRVARAAPADVVLVDTRGGAFLQDIVRVEDKITRPLLLDLGYVSAGDLERLCGTSRVMLFARQQALALGIRPPLYPLDADAITASRRMQLERLRCARPVPLG